MGITWFFEMIGFVAEWLSDSEIVKWFFIVIDIINLLQVTDLLSFLSNRRIEQKSPDLSNTSEIFNPTSPCYPLSFGLSFQPLISMPTGFQ